MQRAAAMRGVIAIGLRLARNQHALAAHTQRVATTLRPQHSLPICRCLCRSLSSASTPSPSSSPLPPVSPPRPSATLSPTQRIEHEFASSALRRSQHAARVEELAALEAQLYAHRQSESASLGWLLRLHWSKHGPIISALVCTLASMTAAYALWKSSHFHGVDLAKQRVELASIQASRQEITRKAEVDAERTLERMGEYAKSGTAIVTAPAEAFASANAADSTATAASTPAGRGWFSWARSAPAAPTPAATPASSSSSSAVPVASDAAGAVTTRTYRASAADLAQLQSLRSTVEAAYAPRS